METPRQGVGRPPAATRDAVERVALSLMLAHGYENVSVEQIAQAAGISRTTFYRYFRSKPGIVWAPFDATITWLRDALAQRRDAPDVLAAVRESIVHSTSLALHDSDVWLERFQLLDGSAELRSDAYEHWDLWTAAVATFIAKRSGLPVGDAVVMAIAGASRSIFVADLRGRQSGAEPDRARMIDQLDEDLGRVFAALRPLLADRDGH